MLNGREGSRKMFGGLGGGGGSMGLGGWGIEKGGKVGNEYGNRG